MVINTVIGTLAADGWDVTFGTAIKERTRHAEFGKAKCVITAGSRPVGSKAGGGTLCRGTTVSYPPTSRPGGALYALAASLSRAEPQPKSYLMHFGLSVIWWQQF